jgi:branched-chain amino acid transport system substrate-binding protein
VNRILRKALQDSIRRRFKSKMKRKGLLKIAIGVSLVATLLVGIPLMGCAPTAPPTAPPVTPPVTPPAAPPEAKVITAKIGFNAPLTGPTAGWGLPGLYGDEIWCDHINAAGGIETLDGTRVMVEMVPYDNEYVVDDAIAGAHKLVLEDNVCLVQHLCGAPCVACAPFYTEHQVIASTLTPPDMNPDFPYLVAPAEVSPYDYVASFEYVKEKYPELKTIAIITQDDENGRSHAALAAGVAEALGWEVVYDKFYDVNTVDFAPVVSAVLATKPDMISQIGAYPDFVALTTEQLYLQGYKGLNIPGTLDFYWNIADKTSWDFLQGTLWVFPDFDDPALTPSPNPYTTVPPKEFWDEYNAKYPGTWSAVSWEYAAILDVWKQGVIYSNSIDPMKVFTAWKTMPHIYNMWGESAWWGREYWGIDNALVGTWPNVEMQGQKGVITGFVDLLDFWDKYGDTLIKVNEERSQQWYQKMGLTKEEAMAQYPEAFE